MTLAPLDERTVNLLEAVADIAFNVGFQDGCRRLKDLHLVEGSRGLVNWIIEKARAFEEVYQHVDWGVDEGFGEYIEVIDNFTMLALEERGLLKGKEDA